MLHMPVFEEFQFLIFVRDIRDLETSSSIIQELTNENGYTTRRMTKQAQVIEPQRDGVQKAIVWLEERFLM